MIEDAFDAQEKWNDNMYCTIITYAGSYFTMYVHHHQKNVFICYAFDGYNSFWEWFVR